MRERKRERERERERERGREGGGGALMRVVLLEAGQDAHITQRAGSSGTGH